MSVSEFDPRVDDTWTGRSRREGDKNPSFDEALEDAYRQARDQYGDEPLYLRVIDFYFTGTNPITEYVVIAGKTGS